MLYVLYKLLGSVVSIGSKQVTMGALVLAFILWFVGIINNGIVAVVAGFRTFLAGLHHNDIGTADFSVLQYIGYVNAIIPVSEFVSLATIYLTAWSLVITFRWIKSLVPTMSN